MTYSAEPWLSESAYGSLKERLVPLYPGIDARSIRAARTSGGGRIKTLVFPYRALRYTGFPYLIRHLQKLWRRRRDFRLVLTDPSHFRTVQRLGERLPFVEVRALTRSEYLRLLWEADIVIGTHNGWNQWSLAAVEALACECVPLFSSESFFPEMLQNCCTEEDWAVVRDRFLYYRSRFGNQLCRLLDDDGTASALATKIGRGARGFYGWERRARAWTECLDLVDGAVPAVTERSQAADALVQHVVERGRCGKSELLGTRGWHVRTRQVAWSRYRKHLRAHLDDRADSDGRTEYGAS